MSFSELIAVYLFLGGAAAGAFTLVAFADVAGHVWNRSRARAESMSLRSSFAAISESTRRYVQTFVYGTGLVSILAGVLCLVADLGRPEAFYYLFLYPTNSLVSIGAFALAFLSVCLVVALSDALLRLPLAMRRFVSVVKLAGIPVALIVMVYTALLLKSVIAVKVWQSPWLSVLFVASALSCGCAVVMLAACACEDVRAMRLWHHFLIPADVAFIVIESIAAIALLVSAKNIDSAAFASLMDGALSIPFWIGFVACGIVLPFIAEMILLFAGRGALASTAAVLAVLVLVGGLCLRISIVACGVAPLM